MRIKKPDPGLVEGDLTPMIDMTFQLIAFFMVLINFTQSEQNERIELPLSELAKPPEGRLEHPITLHVLAKGDGVIYAGREVSISELNVYLEKEKKIIGTKNMPLSKATIVVRADKDAEVGKVQELIQACQKSAFETFALRAKEDQDY